MGEMTFAWFEKLFYEITKTNSCGGWWIYVKHHTFKILLEEWNRNDTCLKFCLKFYGRMEKWHMYKVCLRVVAVYRY